MGCFRPLAGMNCNPAPIRSSSRPMSFRPLAGMNCNLATAPKQEAKQDSFRPLAGMNCNAMNLDNRTGQKECFRPLAGMNCNHCDQCYFLRFPRFRPLAGMNCNPVPYVLPAAKQCFRPLAGMNCNSKTARYNPTVFCSLSQIMAKLQAIQPLYEQQAGQKMLLSWCEPVIQRGL